MSLPIKVEKSKKAERIEKEKLFLIDDNFGRTLINFYASHLTSAIGNGSLSTAIGKLKARYTYYSERKNWRDGMIKTIIWNMCKNGEAFMLQEDTWKRYEQLYYSGALETYRE